MIAAFDPETLRYFSKATKGLAIKAVAVPAFDPRSLDYAPPDTSRDRRMREEWTRAAVISAVTIGLSALALVAQRRWLTTMIGGPKAARRFARRMGRRLSRNAEEGSSEPLAREITQGLIQYARIGTARPPGALTRKKPGRSSWSSPAPTNSPARPPTWSTRCDQALFSDRRTGIRAAALRPKHGNSSRPSGKSRRRHRRPSTRTLS